MNTADLLFNSPLVHALGWTLLHFVWQGAGVCTLYALLRFLLRNASPVIRYNLSMLTLMLMVVLPIVTFIHLFHPSPNNAAFKALQIVAATPTTDRSPSAGGFVQLLDQLRIWLQPLVFWTVPLWLSGVLLMALRALGGWRHVHYLRRTADCMSSPKWMETVRFVSERFGIKKLVRLAVSVSVNVPCVIGWFRPVILLPPSVITGLTPLQIGLILAHELAHIRRQDYLWNLVQITVEVLLFYHPAVRWVSHQARVEREQCCDDMVVSLHGNAIDYARTLTELEILRQPPSALLLGATGGQVLDRIHRLLGLPGTSKVNTWLPLLLITGVLLAALLPLLNRPNVLPTVLAQNYSLLGVPEQAAVAAIPEIQPSKVSVIHAPAIPRTAPEIPISELQSLQPAQLNLAPISAPLPIQMHAPVSDIDVMNSKQSKTALAGGEILSRTAPVYPPLALERGIEGTASVEFTLTASGNITDVHVTRVTGSRLFAQAASEAIRQWKFTSVTLGGVATAQHMAAEFVFNLHTPGNTDNACKIPMGYHVCMQH